MKANSSADTIAKITTHYTANLGSNIGYVMSRGWNKEDSEDVVQEAYERAIKYAPSFNGTGDIDGWFNTILHRRMYDHSNGHRDTSEDQDERWLLDPVQDAEDKAELYQLHKAIRLSGDHWDVLYMSLILGMKSGEVAEKVDLSPSGVRMVVHRFREKVKADE